LKFQNAHLAYCTNIHPAETWAETELALKTHVLAVRDILVNHGSLTKQEPFAIGLRLSALAAEQLLSGNHLSLLKQWLSENHAYVFTINGFPYGNFHTTRVKERVFQPDWTHQDRVNYTKNLFLILAEIAPPHTEASVSTLPGSHKTFGADETIIHQNLSDLALWLDQLSAKTGHDFHLGLEPEPLGLFENTEETLAFFRKLHLDNPLSNSIQKRIGINYDACHFALEFEQAEPSLNALVKAGIRISKIHLSSALSFNPQDSSAQQAIRKFEEPIYFHQVIVQTQDQHVHRFLDLPNYLAAPPIPNAIEARVHFHIPLDAEPAPPLNSTRTHAKDILSWCKAHPSHCQHFEIETYTWAILPDGLKRNVEEQIAAEYHWVFAQSLS
jgi:hypothetical protein